MSCVYIKQTHVLQYDVVKMFKCYKYPELSLD